MAISRPGKPTILRDALLRALEWRARHFSDPADRSQFLRQNLARMSDEAPRRHSYAHVKRTCPRHATRAFVIAVTLLLAFENTPFKDLGLSDNYKLALPSMTLFGFAADPAQIEWSAGAGMGMSQGLEAAIADLQQAAAARDLSVEPYRKELHERYRDAIQALRRNGAYQEYN